MHYIPVAALSPLNSEVHDLLARSLHPPPSYKNTYVGKGIYTTVILHTSIGHTNLLLLLLYMSFSIYYVCMSCAYRRKRSPLRARDFRVTSFGTSSSYSSYSSLCASSNSSVGCGLYYSSLSLSLSVLLSFVKKRLMVGATACHPSLGRSFIMYNISSSFRSSQVIFFRVIRRLSIFYEN